MTYKHFVFLTSFKSALRVNHSRGGVNFEFPLAPSTFNAVLNPSIFADISIVCKYLNM